MEQAKQRIEETKKLLRKQTLATILEQFDDHLMELSPQKRRAKYEKMHENPFSFFRGSAYLFYYDVTNIPFTYHTPADRPTWMMGDLHFDNFSAFQNENKEVVFDVDDFDEGYLGSYLYDVLRMVVSIRLFAEQQGFREEAVQDSFVQAYLNIYTDKLKQFEQEEDNPLTATYSVANTMGPIQEALQKLEERKQTHELEKQTIMTFSGQRLFNREKKKLKSVSDKKYQKIENAWDQYLESIPEKSFRGREHYQIKDIVKKKGSGIGSTGLKRYYILIEGSHDENHEDDIILEAKEARMPVPAYFFPYNDAFWEINHHQGKRVITTQRAMHHLADPYLGYFSLGDREFYVRERSPFEQDIAEDALNEREEVTGTLRTMAEVTAKIHSRADDNIEYGLLNYHSETEILRAIGEDQAGFMKELSVWSRFYKKRVMEDYQIFKEWLEEEFE